MTRQKTLKKAIRARAGKTGERYTAARQQLLNARAKASPPPPAPLAPAAAPSPSTRGLSETAVVKKTGHGYAHWFAVLEAFGAAEQGHTAAARHLHLEHGIPGWHAQGITVQYERSRGLRVANQACSGDFQVSVSRAVAAPVAEVADALGSAQRRARWLPAADPALAAALSAAFAGPQSKTVKLRDPEFARFRFSWDGRPVEIRITATTRGSSVVADNTKLSGPDLVATRRAAWRLALDELKRYLAP